MGNFQKLVKPFVTTSTHKVDVYDLSDATYFIFIIDGFVLAPNSLMGTLTSVQENERVDINGQSILSVDYILENHNGNSVLVKFIILTCSEPKNFCNSIKIELDSKEFWIWSKICKEV